MMIDELIRLISNEESKMLMNYSRTENCYDIAPVDTDGSPVEDSTARPTIVFEILKDELAIKWIYLNKQNQGLGSMIIQWFIEYCNYAELSKISIRLVGKDKRGMIALADKFGFQVIKETSDSLNYGLLLRR